MFCTSCGAQVAEGSAHCTSCGARVDGLGMVASAARTAYAFVDADLKHSLLYGGGSMFASILIILLAFSAPLLLLLLVPAGLTLGILGLNCGRELANRSGYYLAMVGFVACTSILYFMLIAYATKSAATSMAGSAMRGLF